MEVLKINKTKEPSEIKKKKKVGYGSEFSGLIASDVTENEEIVNVASTTSIANLLFLQEANMGDIQRQQNFKRGRDILSKLEEFKNSLLKGNISKAKLEEIKVELKAERAKTQDKKLEEILDEIELRAHIEIAKYESGN